MKTYQQIPCVSHNPMVTLYLTRTLPTDIKKGVIEDLCFISRVAKDSKMGNELPDAAAVLVGDGVFTDCGIVASLPQKPTVGAVDNETTIKFDYLQDDDHFDDMVKFNANLFLTVSIDDIMVVQQPMFKYEDADAPARPTFPITKECRVKLESNNDMTLSAERKVSIWLFVKILDNSAIYIIGEE